MNSNAGEFRAQTPGDERRSSITRRSLITGLQGVYIAWWTRPRPRATPLRRRSARAAPTWHSRRAQRAHATDRGCRAQCGRSNDLLLTRSNELPRSSTPLTPRRSLHTIAFRSSRRAHTAGPELTLARTHAPPAANTIALGLFPTAPTSLMSAKIRSGAQAAYLDIHLRAGAAT